MLLTRNWNIGQEALLAEVIKCQLGNTRKLL
jgi:hypothetical protein